MAYLDFLYGTTELDILHVWRNSNSQLAQILEKLKQQILM